MKFYIPIVLSSISGICCASGQLGRPAGDLSPELRSARIHASWTVFVHPLYRYELPVPPGVRAIGHPEELSETSFESADGGFLMSAWGGVFQGPPAEVIAAQWNLARRKGGRDINYQQRGHTWFVVSGTDVEGIEYYEKFTMRGAHAAFLSIRYPRSRLRQFEQWVEEVEDGFGVSRRGGATALAPQLRVDLRDRESQANRAKENPRVGEAAVPKVREKSPASRLADRIGSGDPAGPRKEGRPESGSDSSRPAPPAAPDSPATNAPPLALKVEGKAGFVYSPFHPDRRLVDVAGIPSGKRVKCPYTLKIFRVP